MPIRQYQLVSRSRWLGLSQPRLRRHHDLQEELRVSKRSLRVLLPGQRCPERTRSASGYQGSQCHLIWSSTLTTGKPSRNLKAEDLYTRRLRELTSVDTYSIAFRESAHPFPLFGLRMFCQEMLARGAPTSQFALQTVYDADKRTGFLHRGNTGVPSEPLFAL